MRILAADDEDINRILAVRLLSRLGHEVRLAHDGVQALALLRREPFDLAILDLHMPALDGLDVTCQARMDGFTGPIVLLSIAFSEETRRVAQAMGVTDFLDKPLEMRQLRAVLARFDGPSAALDHAQASAASEPDVLDMGAVRERVNGDNELLREIFRMYLEDAPARLEAMEAGILRSDVQQVFKAAHSLKGISSSIGSLRLSQAARDVEHAAHEGDLTTAVTLSSRLRDLLSQTLRAVERTLGSL